MVWYPQLYFIRRILGIVRGKLLEVFLLILSLVIMTKEKLEPYEELILSVKRKMEMEEKK